MLGGVQSLQGRILCPSGQRPILVYHLCYERVGTAHQHSSPMSNGVVLSGFAAVPLHMVV